METWGFKTNIVLSKPGCHPSLNTLAVRPFHSGDWENLWGILPAQGEQSEHMGSGSSTPEYGFWEYMRPEILLWLFPKITIFHAV